MRYAPVRGFAAVHLDTQDLEQWRTGHSAANPAEAQALAREVDRLRARLAQIDPDPLAECACGHESRRHGYDDRVVASGACRECDCGQFSAPDQLDESADDR